MRGRLDALQLAEFFLVVRCPVQVQRELAVEPELGRGAERLGQPQGRRRSDARPAVDDLVQPHIGNPDPVRRSAWVMPSGLMNSSSSISPGGVGGGSDGILTCAISVISYQ